MPGRPTIRREAAQEARTPIEWSPGGAQEAERRMSDRDSGQWPGAGGHRREATRRAEAYSPQIADPATAGSGRSRLAGREPASVRIEAGPSPAHPPERQPAPFPPPFPSPLAAGAAFERAEPDERGVRGEANAGAEGMGWGCEGEGKGGGRGE